VDGPSSPNQNGSSSSNEIVAMEEDDKIAGVDTNSDELAGVTTEEDDKIAGVIAQEDNGTAEMAIHDRNENVDMAVHGIYTNPNAEHNSEHIINTHDADVMMELNATNMNNLTTGDNNDEEMPGNGNIHRYNLRPRPTKTREVLNLYKQTNNQLTLD